MPYLDEKREIIVQLLELLRKINPEIGNYSRSVYTSDFEYAVKLDNGRIILADELVQEAERNIAFISESRLQLAARAFLPDTVPSQSSATEQITSSQSVTNSPISNKSNESTNRSSRKSTGRQLVTLLVVVLLAFGGYFMFNKMKSAREENKQMEIKKNIRDYVSVELNDYQYRSMGGIVGLEVILTNTSEYTLDNAKVRLTYIKKNGEVWREHDVDFEMVPPNSSMTMKISDTDRGVSVKARLISVQSNSLGL